MCYAYIYFSIIVIAIVMTLLAVDLVEFYSEREKKRESQSDLAKELYNDLMNLILK
jgi:hypothetical protein